MLNIKDLPQNQTIICKTKNELEAPQTYSI